MHIQIALSWFMTLSRVKTNLVSVHGPHPIRTYPYPSYWDLTPGNLGSTWEAPLMPWLILSATFWCSELSTVQYYLVHLVSADDVYSILSIRTGCVGKLGGGFPTNASSGLAKSRCNTYHSASLIYWRSNYKSVNIGGARVANGGKSIPEVYLYIVSSIFTFSLRYTRTQFFFYIVMLWNVRWNRYSFTQDIL